VAGRDFLFTAARAGLGAPLEALNANNKKKGALVVETLAAKVINPINPKNPLHPDQTSVSVAR
jgi:hypothetical protein